MSALASSAVAYFQPREAFLQAWESVLMRAPGEKVGVGDTGNYLSFCEARTTPGPFR